MKPGILDSDVDAKYVMTRSSFDTLSSNSVRHPGGPSPTMTLVTARKEPGQAGAAWGPRRPRPHRETAANGRDRGHLMADTWSSLRSRPGPSYGRYRGCQRPYLDPSKGASGIVEDTANKYSVGPNLVKSDMKAMPGTSRITLCSMQPPPVERQPREPLSEPVKRKTRSHCR